MVSALVTAAVLYRDTTAYIAHERPLIQVTKLVKLQHELPAKYNFQGTASEISSRTDLRDPDARAQGHYKFDEYKVYICIKDGRVHCLYNLKATASELAQVERLLTAELAELVHVRPEELRLEVVQEMRTENPKPIKRWPW